MGMTEKCNAQRASAIISARYLAMYMNGRRPMAWKRCGKCILVSGLLTIMTLGGCSKQATDPLTGCIADRSCEEQEEQPTRMVLCVVQGDGPTHELYVRNMATAKGCELFREAMAVRNLLEWLLVIEAQQEARKEWM